MWELCSCLSVLEVRNNEWFLKKVFNRTEKTNSIQTNQPDSIKPVEPTEPKILAPSGTPSVLSLALRGKSHVKIAVFFVAYLLELATDPKIKKVVLILDIKNV